MNILYTMPIRFATEMIALMCEKTQHIVSARWFPTISSVLRSKAKVFLQGCPLAPANLVHDLEAVARRQSRRDCHGGFFTTKVGFLPLECHYGLRDNQNIKPDLPTKGQITLLRAGFILRGSV